MFVGSVVAGCVVLASHGAKARGALLRDVGAYAAAVAVLAGFMLTGHISTLQATLLVAMYIGACPPMIGFCRTSFCRDSLCRRPSSCAMLGSALRISCSGAAPDGVCAQGLC